YPGAFHKLPGLILAHGAAAAGSAVNRAASCVSVLCAGDTPFSHLFIVPYMGIGKASLRLHQY
ncbi:MAG: hypothetical protein LC630_03110, partial [Bacteroidales bacterium]|nr:hypothetical protein [Bacteroidales bacterium]